ALAAGPQTTPPVQHAEIRVGIDEGDVRGSDHRSLQAAVDYVAGLGGGTVRIGAGKYLMRNALKLRNNVHLAGVPGKTVLVACDRFSSSLSADGDANERQITMTDPSGFRVGDGVAVQDGKSGGFEVTTATLTAQVGPNTFRLSAPLYLDYLVAHKAAAKLAFPIVGGWNVKNVVIEGLTLDGNRDRAEYLNGCRGGGIYLFECEQVTIRNCTVRRYHGDGISFQVSHAVTVEDCLAENNSGLGLHPGSGSQRPVVRRNRSFGNGSDGLYVCWRVKHGLFEQNEIRGNQRAGISIGHKDTDNLFRDNTVISNGSAGVWFRQETEAMGAHRNVFENNRILDNGTRGQRGSPQAAIVIQGHHHDLVFRGNQIGNTKPAATPTAGIQVSAVAQNLKAENNQFLHVNQEVASQVSSVPSASAAAQKPRPNILFCFADDWGRYASVYARHEQQPSPNQVVKTPNIDRVAQRGVLFRNAFVNAPSCTPCRSALLSGRYFFNTGRAAILQGAVWDSSIPSFPLLLKEAGYFVGKTGKVWSPGTPADAPYGGQAHAFQKGGMRFNNFSEQVTQAVRQNKTVEQARNELLAEVRANFDDLLTAREKGKPFCYWFGPTTVHRTWVKGSGKALWGIDPDALQGKLPPFLPDVPEVREDFADYLGEIQAFDAYVGVLLNRLEAAGELDRTLIVIGGDHGAPGFPRGKCNLYDFGVGVTLVAAWPGGKGGRVVEDFVNLMDLAPTFLEVGGVKPPIGMNGRSILPLLTSEKSGQFDPERTWVVSGRERHVGSARAGNLPYPHRALRNRDFLYIRNFKPDRSPMGDANGVTADKAPSAQELETNTRIAFADVDASPTKAWLVAHRNDPQWKWHYDQAFGKRPAEELYDLRHDPAQVKNVAADAAYASTKQELAGRLLQILKEAGDPRVVDANCRFERPPFTDPEPKKQNVKEKR
ncbi:MAG: sulfatase-like hydrolase/transferase, partial [Gemmataceae bacterium]|nr:sulfatase-like hydrolase/transferase [Gemmataceae bacterium]